MSSKNQSLKKAFFFLRHNNDIDHITPVLYKWLSTEDVPTDIIITTSRSLLEDYRIKYLKKFKNANILYINDLFKKNSFSYLFNIFYFKYDTQLDNVFKKSPFVKRIANRIIKHISNQIFKGVDKGIVVFDWTTTHFVQQMVQIAKNRNFTTISLPHGDAPYFTKFYLKSAFNYGCLDQHEPSKIFDYVVIPNKVCLKRYENYIEKDRIKILGSPRYNDEWREIASKLIPHFNVEESENKLKIVFFLRNIDYAIFWDEVVRTIKLILQFPDVYLIAKHHPRNTAAKKLTKKLLKLYPEVKRNLDVNLKFIYHGMDSASLIKWADIILDLGTSITWDAVKQGKPVLMLEYQYANYSTLAHYMSETEIKCKDQLYDTMQEFITNKNYRFYNEKNRKKFINEIIDVPDKNVLERYSKFLKRCLNETTKKK